MCHNPVSICRFREEGDKKSKTQNFQMHKVNTILAELKLKENHQCRVFVWLASHVLPYLSHRNVT